MVIGDLRGTVPVLVNLALVETPDTAFIDQARASYIATAIS